MAATARTLSGAWLATTATVALLVAAQCLIPLTEAAGAMPCGKTSLEAAAASLIPCRAAASSSTARVSMDCCKRVSQLPPACLCAVLMSPLAQRANIKPAYAVSIPKRCNFGRIARRAGHKCGRFTIP